jgi:hypothetical protein
MGIRGKIVSSRNLVDFALFWQELFLGQDPLAVVKKTYQGKSG